MNLSHLGWNKTFEDNFKENHGLDLIPARVTCQYNHIYHLLTENGEIQAKLSGKIKYIAQSQSELPAVGDWVALQVNEGEDYSLIHAVLPRFSYISRKEVGDMTREQMIAVNIDYVFLVSGLDGDYNPRRIERYLTLAWDSGANPVIFLNKCDLRDDLPNIKSEVESLASEVPVRFISAKDDIGKEYVLEFLTEGKTGVFIGSSGVGKSSIINMVLGENRLKTKDVRTQRSYGRHTTTHRELIFLSEGGMIIDTPGLKEIQLWKEDTGLNEIFDEIEKLATQCKFRDCSHESEPGCAVKKAVESGELGEDRYQSYLKLKKEMEFVSLKKEERIRSVDRGKSKQISKQIKQLKNTPKRK